MAIHFKKLGPRTLSALVFVVALLFCLLNSYLTFTIFFFLVSILGLLEYFLLCDKLGTRPFKLEGMIAGGLTYLFFIDFNFFTGRTGTDLTVASVVLVLPFLIFCAAVFNKEPRPFSSAIYTVAGIVYCVLPFALMHYLVFRTNSLGSAEYSPKIMLGLILLIWTNDTFAYLGGSVFGKHKMLERVSPGKTWEGTTIGVLASFGASYIIGRYIVADESMFWTLAGIFVPILSTVGDLAQSTLKREADVKDTGRIMPGHGGILDRFDSLIFVVPFAVVVLKLISIQNVSG